MAFRYQAVDAAGKAVTDVIEAGSAREAAEHLRERGLFVTMIEAAEEAADAVGRVSGKSNPGGRLADVVFFTQQMSMLIRSGARVVQALEAIEDQTVRPSWRAVLHSVRLDVEEGKPLYEALSKFPKMFPGVYTNMVASGEASGNLGLAFDRLARLTRQQLEIRNRVIGAMAYPAVLLVLCVGVIVALLTVVLPRFADMFDMLDVELPFTTAIMIRFADAMRVHWPYALGIVFATALGAWAFARSDYGRYVMARAVLRVPPFGKVVRNVILARVCRVWGQLIDSKVGLLDAIGLTKESTTSPDFARLLEDVEEAVTQGNSVGPALMRTWLMPRTFAAAIITGEESGNLGPALLFVAECLEDENEQVLSSLTRVMEPIILTFMGVIVGTVAISLFLPMFDMATVTGR